MMNTVNLVGRLTRDPEYTQTASGISVTKFTLAIERSYKNADGERESDFIRCIAFRKTAEIIEQMAVKGALVGVVGHIQTGKYTNDEGNVVFTTDVVVDRFQMLESKKVTDQRRAQSNNNSELDEVFSKAEDVEGFNSNNWPFD